MSSIFSDGQLRQAGNALAKADWIASDLTLLGQAGRDRLIGIRDSLRRGGDIVTAIVEGRTELWLHPGQGLGWMEGRKILVHLSVTGLLASCADIDELRAVQAKGTSFFRKHFPGRAVTVFGWRGVCGGLVPYLIEDDVGRVVQTWHHLDSRWSTDDLALRRK